MQTRPAAARAAYARPLPACPTPGGGRGPGLAEDGEGYGRQGEVIALSARRDPDRARREAADYLAEMCGELAGIARRADLVFLAYILDMAREEASGVDPGR